MDLLPLPAGSSVLRALEAKAPFFRSPDHREPTGSAFKPSTADVGDAERRGLPVGVSVFHREMTTPQQAVGVRKWFADQAGRELLTIRVFELTVDTIRAVVRAYSADGDVVSDPITEKGACDLPGADGHALMVGIYEPSKKLRKGPAYKAMLDKLAEAAELVHEVPRPQV